MIMSQQFPILMIWEERIQEIWICWHDIWNWCVSKDIYISAVHAAELSNVRADFLSRHFSDSTEWALKRQIFLKICKQYFLPDVDLFVSRLNKQTDTFVF